MGILRSRGFQVSFQEVVESAVKKQGAKKKRELAYTIPPEGFDDCVKDLERMGFVADPLALARSGGEHAWVGSKLASEKSRKDELMATITHGDDVHLAYVDDDAEVDAEVSEDENQLSA